MPGLLKAGVAVLLPFLLLLSCTFHEEPVRLSGDTMGTRWHVSAELPASHGPEQLKDLVQRELDSVNESMSTYRDDSDLGRFNRAPVLEWVTISPATFEVTEVALRVSRETDNAFNPAVAELVDLWGFGPSARDGNVPTSVQIGVALEATQLDRLDLDPAGPALRKRAALQLDYSAIAKGYGVDRVAAVLEQAGVRNFMVEVGGEVRTRGAHPDGRPWRIGIEVPQMVQGEAIAALEPNDEAVATSGNYRNYREVDGVRYSHTIDPANGYPVTHNLASVTVVAPTAVVADAYATAISVMGPDEGMAFAESRALPVYMLVKKDSGFEVRHSSAFAPYLE